MNTLYLPKFVTATYGWRWLFNLETEPCDIASYGTEKVVEEGEDGRQVGIDRISLHPVGVLPARNIALVRQVTETDTAMMIEMEMPSRWILDDPFFDEGAMERADAIIMVGELLELGYVTRDESPGNSLYMAQTMTYVPPREIKIWDSRTGPWSLMEEAGIARPDIIEDGTAVPVTIHVMEIDSEE